jgi:hypothetical protein
MISQLVSHAANLFRAKVWGSSSVTETNIDNSTLELTHTGYGFTERAFFSQTTYPIHHLAPLEYTMHGLSSEITATNTGIVGAIAFAEAFVGWNHTLLLGADANAYGNPYNDREILLDRFGPNVTTNLLVAPFHIGD